MLEYGCAGCASVNGTRATATCDPGSPEVSPSTERCPHSRAPRCALHRQADAVDLIAGLQQVARHVEHFGEEERLEARIAMRAVSRYGRRMFIRSVGALVVMLCSGCVTFKDELGKICSAPTLSGARARGETGLRAVGPWLEANIQTDEGRQLVSSLKTGAFEELRAAAKKNGLVSCELVDPSQQSGP